MGKRAIIQEYISGESMMKLLLAGQAQPEDLAAKFAQIHYDMHQCEADGLEDSKVRYERLLKLSEYNLGGDLTNRMLKPLEQAARWAQIMPQRLSSGQYNLQFAGHVHY